MFALLMVGPPGVGKTSVLEALSDMLVVEDVGHGLIETGALASAHPVLADERWVQPIAAVCRLYRRFGYGLLLVAVMVETAEDLRRTRGCGRRRRARRRAAGGRAGDAAPARHGA